MRTVQRPWDWWAYHYRVVHRSQIPGISRWDDELVDLIVHVLELEPGDRVLDLACGSGDHALRLAHRGLDVVGVDIAPSLIAHCRERAAEKGLEQVRFEVGDMRDLAFEGQFDAVLLLSGSFGFFEDEVNRDVLTRVARSLRDPSKALRQTQGTNSGQALSKDSGQALSADSGQAPGRVFIDVFDPASMVVRPPQRTWSSFGGGYDLRTTWWEPESCTYVSEFMFVDSEGVLNTAAEPERIRVYSLPEWRAMLATAGLTLTHALAQTKLPPVAYDRDHYGNLVIVGQKCIE